MKKLTNLGRSFFYRLAGVSMMGFVFAEEEAAAVGSHTINLNPPSGSPFEALTNITLPAIIPVLIQGILIIAALVALIFLIIGGIKWITSGGDKTAVEGARGTVTSALIGLLIVFAAWAIIKLLGFFFGINIFEFDITPITTIE